MSASDDGLPPNGGGGGDRDDGSDAFRDRVERFQGDLADYVRNDATGTWESTSGNGNGNGNVSAERDRPFRHAEDPHSAIPRAGAEVADPELIRGPYAADLGKTLNAVDEHYLFGPLKALVRRVESGIAGIRKGAVVMPAQRASGERLAIVGTTAPDKEREHELGEAAEKKANRRERRLEWERKQLELDRLTEAARRDELEDARNQRARVRQTMPPPTLGGSGFRWLRINPWIATVVAAVDIVVTTLLLEGPLTNIIVFQEPWKPFALAAGVSISVLAASGVAGFALAAARPPGRVIGLVAVALVVAIGVEFIPALDAARAGDDDRLRVLTLATLFACYVAMMTAYSTTAHRLHKRLLKRIAAAGGPLSDADLLVEEAETRLTRIRDEITEREGRCKGLEAEIEELRDYAAKTGSRIRQREADGIRADTELATIAGTCATEVAQENHSREAAIATAELAWRKIRAEEVGYEQRQDPLDPRALLGGDSPPSGPRWPGAAAIAVLAGSALATALSGSVAVAIGGAVVAALLLVLMETGPRMFGSGGRGRGRGDGDGPRVAPAGDSSSPLWRSQPDHMVDKYGWGGSDPTFKG